MSADTIPCDTLRSLLDRTHGAENDIAREITDHVASCATCRQGEQALSSLLSIYSQAPPVELPASLENRLVDRVCRTRGGA